MIIEQRLDWQKNAFGHSLQQASVQCACTQHGPLTERGRAAGATEQHPGPCGPRDIPAAAPLSGTTDGAAMATERVDLPTDEVPLGELGWRGPVKPDDPAVEALRAELQQSAGMQDLAASCVWPDDPDYAQKAKEILARDGFVIVKNVLDAERLATIRRGVDQVVRHMLQYDEARWGNRGSHR